MKHTVIKTKKLHLLLLIIFLSSLVTAINFTLESPEKVYSEEEFIVKIIPSETSSETFDVKIFVHEHTKEFSEIYDYSTSSWKSPFNYIKEAFPKNTEFKLKSHFIGETKVCAKLRSSSNPARVFEQCNNILVEETQKEKNYEIEQQEEQPKNFKEVKNKTKKYIKSLEENIEDNISYKPEKEKSFLYNNEKIVLKEEDEKKENLVALKTKSERLRLFIIYGFTFLCIIIIILLSLKKI